MSTLTPTAASASIAGFGFWALVWASLAKLDTILALFGFKRLGYSRQMRLWVNKNKGLSLCLTEILNFSIHGLRSAEGTTFALGGTLFNVFYICLINPLICRRDKKHMLCAVDTAKR